MDTSFEKLAQLLHDRDTSGLLAALKDIESQNRENLLKRDKGNDESAFHESPSKRMKLEVLNSANADKVLGSEVPTDPSSKVCGAPYFYYKDYSHVKDPDPNTPVTAPGRIPNFPAKMFAILSRPELAHIVSWMPHGRSWKVHKPREFEVKVIPAYFEHSKFSSFIRQANGWGFRRMNRKGSPDRNSYYHEQFLRGKPYLLKEMKRPLQNMKPLADVNTEPYLERISQENPLPEMKQEPTEGERNYEDEAKGVRAHCAFVEQGNIYSGRLITDDQSVFSDGLPSFLEPIPISLPSSSFEASGNVHFHQPSNMHFLQSNNNVIGHVAPVDCLFSEEPCLQAFHDAIVEGLNPADDSFWSM